MKMPKIAFYILVSSACSREFTSLRNTLIVIFLRKTLKTLTLLNEQFPCTLRVCCSLLVKFSESKLVLNQSIKKLDQVTSYANNSRSKTQFLHFLQKQNKACHEYKDMVQQSAC